MKKIYMLYMKKPTVHDYIEKQHEEVTQLFNKYEGNYIIHHEGKNAPYGSKVVALDTPVQEYDFNIIHFEGTVENENEIRLQTPNGEDINLFLPLYGKRIGNYICHSKKNYKF